LENCNALIDTGAMLAGISNSDAALRLVSSSEIKLRFEGVIYFQVDDTSALSGSWMVISCATLVIQPIQQSPILPSNAFIIFDDARCRGSDFKMKRDSIALITLGMELTKDKLMQGIYSPF
jgi:hypothetical protein